MFEYEKITETKKCKHCNISFDITDKDLEFYEKISPVFAGEKYKIPTPTLCPECRQQRRLSFRNERSLYKRKCDFSGKEIVSIYSPDKPYKVYDHNIWWSDKWDPMDYGRDFDFSKSFFEQFKNLVNDVPRFSVFQQGISQNSEYTNVASNNNNSYLIFSSNYDESCFYGDQNKYSGEELMKMLVDLIQNTPNKNYTGNNNEKSTGDYINNCKNGVELYDCINCEDVKYSQVLIDAKNCMDYSHWGRTAEYVYESQGIGYNCYDILFSSSCASDISKLIYCDLCGIGTSDCFGCVGLKGKQYCILNKQYTKDQYEQLVPKIIEHMMKPHPPRLRGTQGELEWGEFFPSYISTFGYNETIAMEYFPKTKREILGCHSELVSESTKESTIDPEINSGGQLLHGDIFNWNDYEPQLQKVEKIIPAEKLPDDIKEIPDDILNWAIECEVTKKPFRIIKTELEFYRKHNLPIPKKHPDERYRDRMKLKNPRKLFDRKCDKCSADIKTSYSPDRKELVYCEKCYNKEVY